MRGTKRAREGRAVPIPPQVKALMAVKIPAAAVAITPIPFARLGDVALDGLKSKGRDSFLDMKLVRGIAEGLGIETTADLTPDFLDRFVASLRGRELSDRRVARYLDWFRRLCKLAIRMRSLEASPFDARPDLVRWMRGVWRDAREGRAVPTPAQVAVILTRLKSLAARDPHAHRLYVLVIVVVYTGISTRNALAIRVRDVDLEAATIRYGWRDGRERSVMLREDLARELRKWWLRTRCRSIAYKLDASKAAEARRLKAEGFRTSELARQFGVGYTTMKNALIGRTWPGLPAGAEGQASRVVDQEWLLPGFHASDTGHWSGQKRGSTLDVAGQAAGIVGLTLADLRRFHKAYLSPKAVLKKLEVAVATGRATVPPRVPATCPVRLGTEGDLGCWIGDRPKPLKTATQRRVIEELIKAQPDGLTGDELRTESGCGDARGILYRPRKDADWRAVIHLPKTTRCGRYRIVRPASNSLTSMQPTQSERKSTQSEG
jgi:integrase